MPKVRITEDTLWYDRAYSRGEEVVVDGTEYLDLLMAGRVKTLEWEQTGAPAPAVEGGIEGRHAGEMVFVLGNGPSLALAQPHLDEFARFTTIGVNNSFLMLPTTYLIFLDAAMWIEKSKEITECGSKVFCPKKLCLRQFTEFGRYHKRSREDVLSEKWSNGLFWSRSSGVAAVNLAYIFGAAEIVLLGIDLNDSSHFYSEKGKNRKFLHADQILEDLWWMSRKMLERGIKLWNCSKESAVRGFEKIEIRELLERR